MNNLSLTCETPFGEKEIIKSMEDIILPNYLPELKLHWKKAMRWIYAYRIIFSVLYGGVLIFLSIKFGHMKFSIMIIHFFLLILLLLIWCIITFLWIKTSPERYKWFKIAQKNFNNDFEEVFYEKKKELYEYVFKKIMPTVEVDFAFKKERLSFRGNEKLESFIEGKSNDNDYCYFLPWNSDKITNCALSHPDFLDVCNLTQVHIDLESKMATITLEGESLNLDFPYAIQAIKSLCHVVKGIDIAIHLFVKSDENTLAENVKSAKTLIIGS